MKASGNATSIVRRRLELPSSSYSKFEEVKSKPARADETLSHWLVPDSPRFPVLPFLVPSGCRSSDLLFRRRIDCERNSRMTIQVLSSSA